MLLFGLWRSGHHNKAIHRPGRSCISTASDQSLIKDFLLGTPGAEGRDLWLALVTFSSNRVLPHPVAAGLRPQSAPLKSTSARITINWPQGCLR